MNTQIQNIIERTITVRASKETVFDAIVNPEKLVLWFPDKFTGTMAVGEEPILNFGDYGDARIHIVAIDPQDYFAYRWIPGCDDLKSDINTDILSVPNTLVEFRLESTPDGTVVRLTESGFASMPETVAAKMLIGNTDGWAYMFDRLEKLLAA